MRTKKSQLDGYINVLIAGLIWGTIGPFMKILSNFGSTPTLTSFLRMFFAFLILLVITVKKFGLKALKIDKRSLLLCAAIGIICQALCNIFYTLSVDYIGVTISVVLQQTAPLFTAILSFFIFKEKITSIKALALFINVFGCILAAIGGSLDLKTFSLVGVIYGTISGFCYSMTAILGRFTGKKLDPYIISTYSYFFASIMLLFIAKPWQLEQAKDFKILSIAFLFALIPTAIAYIIYYKGVNIITESSKVPVIASIETIVGTYIAYLFFKEKIGLINYLGIFLVMASILVMNHRKKLVK